MSADFSMGHPVENIPPECFQDYSTANGTQGGAVLVAPPSKSCRFSHPPSPCAKSTAQGISLSADSDLEGTCPLRESILHLGVCRLRRQIFREMKGKAEEILCGFPSIFLKYLGKDASKMHAKRYKIDSKTSPTALSWISLTSPTISVLFVSARCERIHQQTLTMFHVKHPLTLLSASAPVRRGRPYRRTPAPVSLYSSHRSRKPAVPDGSPD